jgi:hypothetical protein
MSFEELSRIESEIEEAYSDLIRCVENQQLRERLKSLRDSKADAMERLTSLGCL